MCPSFELAEAFEVFAVLVSLACAVTVPVCILSRLGNGVSSERAHAPHTL